MSRNVTSILSSGLFTFWNHAPSIHASLSLECVSFLCKYPNRCHWNWSQELVFLHLIDLHGVVVYLNCQIYKNRNMLVDMEILGWIRALFTYVFCCKNFYWCLPLWKCIQDLVLIEKHMIISSIVHTFQIHMHSGESRQ